MTPQLLRIVLVLLVSLATQWSCRTSQDALVQPANAPISISEAHDWYEGRNAGARVAAKNLDNRLVYWKYAKNDYLPNGTPVVVVPLLYGYDEPLMVGKDAYMVRPGKLAKINVPKADVRIQKKLMIAKDAGGQYKSCVMVVVPSSDYRKKTKRVKRDDFDGTVLIYDENEEYYLMGLTCKNGRLKQVLKSKSAKGGRLSESCYRGTYQYTPARTEWTEFSWWWRPHQGTASCR